MTDHISAQHPLLRRRDGHHARVSYAELFFDLVYVFAVTQLSHELLTNLTLTGLVQTLILWFVARKTTRTAREQRHERPRKGWIDR